MVPASFVEDVAMARRMAFTARWGAACEMAATVSQHGICAATVRGRSSGLGPLSRAAGSRHCFGLGAFAPWCWICCLLLSAFLLAAAGAQELPPETVKLARIRQKAAEQLSSLPDYTCLETVERTWRAPGWRSFTPSLDFHGQLFA